MDVLPLGLVGDAALRAAVVADHEVTCMEGVRMDHLAEYLGEMREAYVAPTVQLPGEEALLQLGGPGTPEVAEFTVCEVAAALALSQPAATGLCADVLDLTYRLPGVAGCVRVGQLPFARARMIARRTRDLSRQECALVEASLLRTRDTGRGPMPVATLVAVGRLRAMVDQAVVTVRGPESVQEAQQRVAASLYAEVVHEVGGASDLAARLAVDDATRLDRRLDEIAGWLTDLGDDRPKAILRAVALGLLADPDLLIALTELRGRHAEVGEVSSVGESGLDPTPEAALPEEALPELMPSGGSTPSDNSLGQRSPGLSAPDPRAPGIAGLPPGLLEKLATLRSTVLYVHLDRGTGTWCEEGAGVLTKEQAGEIVGHANVTVRPVLDLAEPLTYTGYEAPPRLKEQLALLNAGYCTFPHCHRRARPSDVDHQQTYGSGGATSSRNTHRLCRKHHRAKDKGRWRVVSPAPGFWIWASPAGAVWLVSNGVTTCLNGIFVKPAAPSEVDGSGGPGSGGPEPSGPGSAGPGGRGGPAGSNCSGVLTAAEHEVSYGFIDTG